MTDAARQEAALECTAMSADERELQGDVVTERHTATHKPRAFHVVLYNDDYTTMDFVEAILVKIFHHSPSTASQLMLEVHTKGKAVAGTYTREIAETKQAEAVALARQQGHPLKCTVEPA